MAVRCCRDLRHGYRPYGISTRAANRIATRLRNRMRHRCRRVDLARLTAFTTPTLLPNYGYLFMNVLIHAPSSAALARARNNVANLLKVRPDAHVRLVLNGPAVAAALDGDCLLYTSPSPRDS